MLTIDDSFVGLVVEALHIPISQKEIANVLFKTLEDVHDFYYGFYGNNNYVIDDLMDYREKRISLNNTSLDEFLWACDSQANRHVFENTFLQYFSDEDIHYINKAIDEGRTTLEDIFEGFKANPSKNILKNIL